MPDSKALSTLNEQQARQKRILGDWNKVWEVDNGAFNLLSDVPKMLWNGPSDIDWLAAGVREYLNSSPGIVMGIIGQRKYSGVAASIVHGLASTAVFFIERYQNAAEDSCQSYHKHIDFLDNALQIFNDSQPEKKDEIVKIIRQIAQKFENSRHPKSRIDLLIINVFVALNDVDLGYLESMQDHSTEKNKSPQNSPRPVRKLSKPQASNLKIDASRAVSMGADNIRNSIIKTIAQTLEKNLDGADDYSFREWTLRWLSIPDFSYEPVSREILRSLITCKINEPETPLSNDGHRSGKNYTDHILERGEITPSNTANICAHKSRIIEILFTQDCKFIVNPAFSNIYKEQNGELESRDYNGKKEYLIDEELTSKMGEIASALSSRAGIRNASYKQISIIIKTIIGMVITYVFNTLNSFTSLSQFVIPLGFYSSVKVIDYLSDKLVSRLKNVMDIYNEVDRQFQVEQKKLLDDLHIYPTVNIKDDKIEVKVIECSPELQRMLKICAQVYLKSKNFQDLDASNKAAVCKIIFISLSKRTCYLDWKWCQAIPDIIMPIIDRSKFHDSSFYAKIIPNYSAAISLMAIEGAVEDSLNLHSNKNL